MSWDEHAQRPARTPVWVVEVDLDWVDDAGLTATNPDDSRCYRTPATTAQGAVTVVTRTRRWMTAGARPIPELGAIPCLGAVSIAAEEVRIGRGLGAFGQATINVSDFVDDDHRTEDPFVTDTSRTGDTAWDPTAGTYLTKLMARNPWWTGRAIRIIEGWATDGVWHPDDTITHNFFVRDVQGPSDGQLKITAAGPLQLLNLSEAEAPKALGGSLAAGIDAVVTSAAFSDPVIADDYAASGYLRLGDEVVSFTRSGAALTLVRAQLGTLADSHDAGDDLVQCTRYDARPITAIIADLLTTYGGVDTGLIDADGWETERATWLSLYNLSGTVTQPTKVLDLVRELLEMSGSILWWDDQFVTDDLQVGRIRFRTIRPALQPAAAWNDRSVLLSRPVVKRDLGERVSRTDVLIDLRSADLDPGDSSSYRARVIGIPLGEEATEHGSQKLKLISSRWLSAAQVSLATRAGFQVTTQLRDGRQTITVEVSAKDAGLRIGDSVVITSRDLIDRSGQPEPTRGLVVKREPVAAGSRYRYTLERVPFGGRFFFLTDVGLPDYGSATAEQRDPAGFLAPISGAGFGPHDPPYVLG